MIKSISETINISTDQEVVKSVILSKYTHTGQVYINPKIYLSQMYLLIIEKYYSEGIKFNDASEMRRFREYFQKMFGNIKLSKNNKKIELRISRFTVLYNRGKYILPNKINVSMELLEKIRSYIFESDRSIIMFAELFERFKNELMDKSNITNKYFLQGVLKYYYPDDFFYSRDTLNKDNNSESSIRVAIEEFLIEEGNAVSREKLNEEFPGITDAVLQNAVNAVPDIIAWDFTQYIHSSVLKINEEEYERIYSLLHNYIGDGFITTRKLLDNLNLVEKEFLLKNNIHNHIALFGVLLYMFKDEFEFKRPYIAKKGSSGLTNSEIIKVTNLFGVIKKLSLERTHYKNYT